jgi:hypothetical protein
MVASATGISGAEKPEARHPEKRTASVQGGQQFVAGKKLARARGLILGKRIKRPCRSLQVARELKCTFWVSSTKSCSRIERSPQDRSRIH